MSHTPKTKTEIAPVPAGRDGDNAPPQKGEERRPPPSAKESGRPDPTRYGDWEKNGRCIDF